jgi:hypothetical protein
MRQKPEYSRVPSSIYCPNGAPVLEFYIFMIGAALVAD